MYVPVSSDGLRSSIPNFYIYNFNLSKFAYLYEEFLTILFIYLFVLLSGLILILVQRSVFNTILDYVM